MRNLLILLFALMPTTLYANTPSTQSGETSQAELTVKLASSNFSMDVVNGFGSVLDEGDFTFIEQTDKSAELDQSGGTLEFNLLGREGTLNGMLDSKYRFNWKFGFDKVSLKEFSVINTTSVGYLDVLPIDGSTSPGAVSILFPGDSIGLDYEINYRRIFSALGVTRPLTENTKATLSFYLSASQLEIKSEVAGINIPGTSINLDESVRSYSIGPKVEINTTKALSNDISLFLNADASILYTNGKFDGDQTSSYGNSTASDSSSDLGGSVRLDVGLSYKVMEDTTLSLFGGTEYRTDVYELINPRSTDGLVANDHSSYNPGSAHIEQTNLVSFFGGVQIKIAF